ncbi:PREDICTED: conserved oligomeric Golgi complex subunit 7 [Ceratosolen solmsi marchali]|uniref:Conserved oligomeric Golgi complex subunit 7 n=1 Tax=Ceratosolen solmsi marchali TaxID=326594 RepID=A0AAJ6YQQ5_9HYME|nr:PREDICTED: conserved oligomeric Golgi complex subunit 7 [Ceratosolen solmsi marchali]
MDISTFNENDFDPIDFINKICRSEEARANIEAHLSSILMKLQLYIQQVHVSLEETNQNVLSNMPKVLRDTQLLQQEAQALKNKMQTVRMELENVKKDTSSIYVLMKLDKLKAQTISNATCINEDNTWSILIHDIDSVFESENEETIAKTLYSMKQSLSSLNDSTDFKNKKSQLEELKNRLEIMIRPKLMQAFTSGSLDESKIYVDIFLKMDRLTEVIKYYHNCQKFVLIQEWKKIIEFAQDKNISYWLQVYYDKVVSVLHDQVKWCNQVFPNFTLTTLVELFADLLHSLNPSIVECIDSTLKQHSNSIKLMTLMELKQRSHYFASNIKAILEAESLDRIPVDKVLSLAQIIYIPYVPYISKYGMYEISYLCQQLEGIEFVHEDLKDTINAISHSLTKIMDYANEANTRCNIFTNGCGYPYLIKTFDIYFNNYLKQFKLALKQLNKRKVKYEDWNLFQMCLTMMQTTGEFFRLVEQFEENLFTNVINSYIILQNPTKSVFEQYINLLLIPATQIEFQEFVTSIQKEEKSILNSTLKSIQSLCIDLHRSTYEVIFAPIFTQLLQIKKAPAWSMNLDKGSFLSLDLPDYSFAPQEYITQVGQYLMTLPQHLEPFLLKDNPSLTKALKIADSRYSEDPCESGFTNILLEIVAKEICQMFQDQTWSICELNTTACKQLATDIDYLGNILEELGLSLSENLQQMSQLLRLSPENYYSGSFGCNAHVVATVRQMRNITSSL